MSPSPWRRPLPRTSIIGDSDTVIVTRPKPSAPRDSWWTRSMASRAEFDQMAAQRGREAGWTGVSAHERGKP